MNFQQTIEALQQRWPGVPIGATALEGSEYHQRAVGITDYEQVDDYWYVGHGVNGKQMWVYYSEKKNVICCGDKET